MNTYKIKNWEDNEPKDPESPRYKNQDANDSKLSILLSKLDEREGLEHKA